MSCIYSRWFNFCKLLEIPSVNWSLCRIIWNCRIVYECELLDMRIIEWNTIPFNLHQHYFHIGIFVIVASSWIFENLFTLFLLVSFIHMVVYVVKLQNCSEQCFKNSFANSSTMRNENENNTSHHNNNKDSESSNTQQQ